MGSGSQHFSSLSLVATSEPGDELLRSLCDKLEMANVPLQGMPTCADNQPASCFLRLVCGPRRLRSRQLCGRGSCWSPAKRVMVDHLFFEFQNCCKLPGKDAQNFNCQLQSAIRLGHWKTCRSLGRLAACPSLSYCCRDKPPSSALSVP